MSICGYLPIRAPARCPRVPHMYRSPTLYPDAAYLSALLFHDLSRLFVVPQRDKLVWRKKYRISPNVLQPAIYGVLLQIRRCRDSTSARRSANSGCGKLGAVALRPLKSTSRLVARAANVRAQITYALGVALEWIALVLTVFIAIGVMLVASVLYSIIWFVRRLLEGP
jgi:hypothetical protein